MCWFVPALAWKYRLEVMGVIFGEMRFGEKGSVSDICWPKKNLALDLVVFGTCQKIVLKIQQK